MDAGPGTDLGTLGWYLGIWVTMMAAMMLPSAAPTVLMFARSRGGAQTWAFVVGYLLAWTGYGLTRLCHLPGDPRGRLRRSWPGMSTGRWVAGGALVAAGVYQLTPLKSACLRHCRSPLHFLLRGRPGFGGALWMGIEHGAVCVGCCIGLMLALFALGVMSLFWMALVAAAILDREGAARRRGVRARACGRPHRAGDLGRRRARERAGSDPAGRHADADGDAGNELADPRHLLRVVQLRRDLPLPPHRRRAGRALDARRLHGRALVADRGGRARTASTSPGSRSRWPCATATTSRARRGRGSCTSTRGRPTSSAPRSRRSSPAVLGGDADGPLPVGVEGQRARRRAARRDRRRPHAPAPAAARSATASASASATATRATRRSAA